MEQMLERMRHILGALARIEIRARGYRDAATQGTGRAMAANVSGTDHHSRVEMVVKAIDMEHDAQELRAEYNVLLRKICPYIDLMPPGPVRVAAYLRYVERMSVAQVGRKMRYDRRYVYKLLDQAAAILGMMYRAMDGRR